MIAPRPRGCAAQLAEALAWCPPEHRSDYDTLRNKHFSADEARRIIEDHMAVIARRSAA